MFSKASNAVVASVRYLKKALFIKRDLPFRRRGQEKRPTAGNFSLGLHDRAADPL